MKVIRAGYNIENHWWEGMQVECDKCGCRAILDNADKPKPNHLWSGSYHVSCPTRGCHGYFGIYNNGGEIQNHSQWSKDAQWTDTPQQEPTR